MGVAAALALLMYRRSSKDDKGDKAAMVDRVDTTQFEAKVRDEKGTLLTDVVSAYLHCFQRSLYVDLSE
jgi:hypothetical protein